MEQSNTAYTAPMSHERHSKADVIIALINLALEEYEISTHKPVLVDEASEAYPATLG